MKQAPRRNLPILEVYVFRKILFPALVVAVVLLAALSLERVLRLVQLVTSNGLPAFEALRLIVYLIPHYLGLALPAGFFFGTILGIRALHERSELVVMLTFGLSMPRMVRPILVLAVGVAAILFYLTAFAQPHARYRYREQVNAVTSQNVFAGLQAGVFHPIGERIVIRADRIRPDGMTFEGFFMAKETDAESRVYLTAEIARRLDDSNPDPQLVAEMHLTRGVVLDEQDGPDGKTIAFQADFEEFPVAITTENVVEIFGPRGRDERELSLSELKAGGVSGRPVEASPAELTAEWHARLASVASVPLLGLLAIPLALMGRGRGARARGLAIGIILFIAFEKLAGVGEVMAADGRMAPSLALWTPWLLLALTTAGFLYFSSGAWRNSRPKPAPLTPNRPQEAS